MYLLLIFDHETPQSFFLFKPDWLDSILYRKVNFRLGGKYTVDFLKCWLLTFKANVSQEILNWHSLRHSHSADTFIA